MPLLCEAVIQPMHAWRFKAMTELISAEIIGRNFSQLICHRSDGIVSIRYKCAADRLFQILSRSPAQVEGYKDILRKQKIIRSASYILCGLFHRNPQHLLVRHEVCPFGFLSCPMLCFILLLISIFGIMLLV